MALGMALSVIMLAQTAAPGIATDAAPKQMAPKQVAATSADARDAIDRDDPAALISLGVEYARSGQTDLARDLLNAAARSETRYRLETADGEWVDSRRLALKVITMIDNGDFAVAERVASR